MKFSGDDLRQAEMAEAAGAELLVAAYSRSRRAELPPALIFRDLVIRYRAAPDGLLRLKASTRAEWARWLDRIVDELGTLPIKALKSKGARGQLMAWRDERAATPRAADYGVQVVKRVLSWALDRQLIEVNPAEGIEALYRNNRADMVIEDHELEAILRNVGPNAASVVRLAAATGMRRGDLTRLKWDHLSGRSLVFTTAKSNGATRVVVPLTKEAQALVGELQAERDRRIEKEEIPSAFMLTTRFNKPWTDNAVTQAFIRGARAAGVDKNFHDLRGTAVTRLALAGIEGEEIADIVGWEPTKVRRIIRHYVDRDRIALGVIERLERAEKTG